MKIIDTFADQLEELNRLESRQEYAKAALIYNELYDTELRLNSKFILKYSLFLEKNRALEKSLDVLSTFLQSNPRLDKLEREQFNRRIKQLSMRVHIPSPLTKDKQTMKTKIKDRFLNTSRRDFVISVVLLVTLVSMAIFSTVYKETYDAKLLNSNMDIFISESTLSKSDKRLPAISAKSIQAAQDLLDNHSAISRSTIIIRRGIVGIAIENSPISDVSETKKIAEQALKLIAHMNEGGEYHLRGPTAKDFGGLFDYYNAFIVLTNAEHKPISTGIKERTYSKLLWESN